MALVYCIQFGRFGFPFEATRTFVRTHEARNPRRAGTVVKALAIELSIGAPVLLPLKNPCLLLTLLLSKLLFVPLSDSYQSQGPIALRRSRCS